MSDSIEIMAPAKINLTLKVGKRRKDGYHPIDSVMQSISLCDYINIELTNKSFIQLDGSSDEIPYDEKNIAYLAAKLYMEHAKIKSGVNIYIKKNIPVCAGLAGGSTDAAAVLYGMNKLFDNKLSSPMLHKICAMLGSDLNFCLTGGLKKASGRGEILKNMEYKEFALCVVKPKNLQISTKDAYNKFDELQINSDMPNDLEFAMLPYHDELRYLHNKGFQMSGSGPSFFIKKQYLDMSLDIECDIFENLTTVSHGVCEI